MSSCATTNLGVDLGDLATRGLHGRFLLRIVEPEERRALGDLSAIPDIDLGSVWRKRI
jgi:hypothetical protein